jgi:hypothetical protein
MSIASRPKSKNGDAPYASDPLSCFERVSQEFIVSRNTTKVGVDYRVNSLTEVGKMIEDGRVVPITKPPKRSKKLEGAFSASTMPTEG